MKSMTVSIGEYLVPISSPVTDSLCCMLCSNILVKPHHGPCGCRFCLECITDYLKENDQICPGKTEDCGDLKLNIGRDFRPDTFAKREINKISVQCPLIDCNEQCEFGAMSDHLIVCSASEVCCQVCGDGMNRGVYDVHVAKECKQTIVECEACQKTMPRISLNEEHHNYKHENLCDSYRDYCPDECGDIEKVLWKEHRRVCANTKVSCPYHTIGCSNQVATMVAMTKHMIDNGYGHAEMLLKHIDNLNNEIACLNSALVKVTDEKMKIVDTYGHQDPNEVLTLKQQMSAIDESVARLKIDNSKMMPQVRIIIETEITSAMKSANNMHKVDLDQLNEDIVKMRSDIEVLKKDRNKNPKPYVMSNTEEKSLPVINLNDRDIRLNWIVKDFYTLHNATSPVFYSHDRGYKLSLKIKKQKTGFLSIYAQLRCGEYDGDLAWPIRKCITIRIVDHVGFCRHYDKVVIIGDKAYDICDRKYGIATRDFGHSKFIAYDDLKLKTHLSKDNFLFINCFVEDLKK